MPNRFITVILAGYNYHAGYGIKIRLRSSNGLDISITQEFPAPVNYIEVKSESEV